MADLFKVRVGVVVFDEMNRILLARQNKRPFWVLPGGTLEEPETIGECAVREIKEEANLDVVLGPLLFVADFFAPDGRHIIDLVFRSQLLGGLLERETSENLDEIAFFSLQEAQALLVKPELVFSKIYTAWEANQWPQAEYLGVYTP